MFQWRVRLVLFLSLKEVIWNLKSPSDGFLSLAWTSQWWIVQGQWWQKKKNFIKAILPCRGMAFSGGGIPFEQWSFHSPPPLVEFYRGWNTLHWDYNKPLIIRIPFDQAKWCHKGFFSFLLICHHQVDFNHQDLRYEKLIHATDHEMKGIKTCKVGPSYGAPI